VDTLDLNIKECIGVNFNTRLRLNQSSKTRFIGTLNINPLLVECLVVGKLLKALEQSQVVEEIVATELLSNQTRKLGVSLVQPSSGSNTVGNIGELLFIVNFDKVLENSSLNKLRVQLGNTIDLVRANDGQVGHADLARVGFFNNGNA